MNQPLSQDRYMDAAHQLNLIAQGNSAGVVYWKPAGLSLYEKLKNFIRQHHEKRGYMEVKSPSMVVAEVFEQSGHMEKYRENMFFIQSEKDDKPYAMRPMSCPNHILIYQSEHHSYRQLPYRLFEFGEVFRNESSGSLQQLFRQRQFCQDDGHVFVSEENLLPAIINYLQMSQEVYAQLGFEKVHFAISLRPEFRFGEDSLWDKAEASLKQACDAQNLSYELLPGEGAFYGPKIELQVQDKLGRFWQLGTLQLDYVLPERFALGYIDEKGQSVRPILLHHAVLGSLERMIGILLESYGVHLPEFLHPYAQVIVAVSEKSHDYAHVLAGLLKAQGKVIVDDSNEPLGKKLENWRNRGVPAIYVVGEKEAQHYEQNQQAKAMLNRGASREVVIIE